MMTIALMISLISNVFTLYVLKHILNHFSTSVHQMQREVELLGLEMKMLK